MKHVFIPGCGFKSSIATLLPMPCISLEYRGDLTQKRLDQFLARAHTLIPPNSTLIAWSMGGLLAMLFCHAFPAHCRKLILLASTPYFTAQDNWPGISKQQANKISEQLSSSPTEFSSYFLALTCFPKRSNKLTNYHYTPSIDQLEFLFATDMRDIYSRLALPTELYLAEHYAIIPSIKLATACRELNPMISVSLIKNASHDFFIHDRALLKEIIAAC